MEKQANNEGGLQEDPGTSNQCKPSKGKRSTQGHRLDRRVCRRLLRQKINAKLKALQELIPNCSKRGQASILDDAINCIQKLQFQLQMMTQMMSMRAMCSTFQLPPVGMMPQPGMVVPFLQTRTGSTDEMKYEIETSTLEASSSDFPMGVPNPPFLPPPAVSYNQMQQYYSAMRGGSTARVLPTQIVPPPHDHAVTEDPSHSGSSEWFSSSDIE